MVRRPNNSTAGPFALAEMPSPFFGRYYFDFPTATSDPQGEYFALVISPTEMLQDTLRMPIYNSVDLTFLQELLSAIVPVNINASVQDNAMVFGQVEVDQLSAFVEDCDWVSATVDCNDLIIGSVQDVDISTLVMN